ncbi:MAG: hypothetical protein BMS9Abin13_204 [Patescibacteria group bacterium]|nr:MAG: hypothetical protein BMS9Abin13_204 [Patescibacteria group bacterium]
MTKTKITALVVAALLIGFAGSYYNTGDTGLYPKEVTLGQDSGKDVRWILPGVRNLDASLFGIPSNPLGLEKGIGVPLAGRLINSDGTAYTTTAGPTPFSDNFKAITGSFSLTASDVTNFDSKGSGDLATAEFAFTDPTGKNQYRVVLKKIIKVGPEHPVFGGVLVDGFHHGKTGIGTRLMPTVYTYAAVWGVAELYINDELISGNRLVHIMASESVRNEDDYKVLIDSELPHKGIQTHLILANKVATPDGPKEEAVPSQFLLPNGVEQPFIHIMFEDVIVKGLEVL